MASKEKQKKGLKIMSFYRFYSNKSIKSEPTTTETVVVDKPTSHNSSMPTVKEIRVQETDHGGGQRRRVAEEVVESRKSVSHVETNLGSVASFLQVKVLVTDMPGFMQVHAFRCARRTFDSLEKFSSKHMAFNIKKGDPNKPCVGVAATLRVSRLVKLIMSLIKCMGQAGTALWAQVLVHLSPTRQVVSFIFQWRNSTF